MFKSLELKIRENPLILPKPLIQSKSAISKDILIRKSFYCESTLRNAFFFITREIMAVENRQKFVKHLAIFHTQQLVKIFKIPFFIMFQVPELVESGIYRVQHFSSWQSQESIVSLSLTPFLSLSLAFSPPPSLSPPLVLSLSRFKDKGFV